MHRTEGVNSVRGVKGQNHPHVYAIGRGGVYIGTRACAPAGSRTGKSGFDPSHPSHPSQTSTKPRIVNVRQLRREKAILPADCDTLDAVAQLPETRRCPIRLLRTGEIPYCPWVGCRYHTYLDVMPNGSIRFNFPGLEVWEVPVSCALIVANEGEHDMVSIGRAIGVCRERVRQIMENLYRRLRHNSILRQARGGYLQCRPT